MKTQTPTTINLYSIQQTLLSMDNMPHVQSITLKDVADGICTPDPISMENFFAQFAQRLFSTMCFPNSYTVKVDGWAVPITQSCKNMEVIEKVDTAIQKLTNDERTHLINALVSQAMGQIINLGLIFGGPKLKGQFAEVTCPVQPYIPDEREKGMLRTQNLISITTIQSLLEKNPRLTPGRNLMALLPKNTRQESIENTENRRVPYTVRPTQRPLADNDREYNRENNRDYRKDYSWEDREYKYNRERDDSRSRGPPSKSRYDAPAKDSYYRDDSNLRK